MSKIPEEVQKLIDDYKYARDRPTAVQNDVEFGYSLSLIRIGELEKENKEHIENVNTLGKMQSESMGWLVESEKKVKSLEKENEMLKSLINKQK